MSDKQLKLLMKSANKWSSCDQLLFSVTRSRFSIALLTKVVAVYFVREITSVGIKCKNMWMRIRRFSSTELSSKEQSCYSVSHRTSLHGKHTDLHGIVGTGVLHLES